MPFSESFTFQKFQWNERLKGKTFQWLVQPGNPATRNQGIYYRGKSDHRCAGFTTVPIFYALVLIPKIFSSKSRYDKDISFLLVLSLIYVLPVFFNYTSSAEY
jgi:hypothetical protein